MPRMLNSTAIVILAAGRGTRMKSDLPKVLHPLAGKPLLSPLLETVESLNAADIFIVTGFGADTVQKTLSELHDTPLNYVIQTEQLGTGHAVTQALLAFEKENKKFERVLILVGDTPLISKTTLQQLLATDPNTIGLLTAEVTDPTGLGRILRDEKQQVLGIVEEKDATPLQKNIPEINTGIMIVPTADLQRWLDRLTPQNAQGEYYLTDLFAMARAENYPIDTTQPLSLDEIASVNDKLQLARLERLVQKRQAEDLMRQGVTLIDPARLDVRGTLKVGRDVVIDIDVVIEGNVTLGDNCCIESFVVLKNVTLAEAVTIKSHCHIEGATIGAETTIGPFARLRPGTVLDQNVRIGNFVEIKKSTIAKGSKVNHLTYVGDATVGSGVNIGAGVITANYDGVNKWKTEIEDEASIGANSVLVAPVKVGKAATIGALSIIRKEAPAGELTISTARQQPIVGWKRPEKK